MISIPCNRCGSPILVDTHIDGTPKTMLCSSCQPKPAPLRMADAVMSRMLGDKAGAP